MILKSEISPKTFEILKKVKSRTRFFGVADLLRKIKLVTRMIVYHCNTVKHTKRALSNIKGDKIPRKFYLYFEIQI